MTYDVEYLCICLFFICIFVLVRWQFRTFAHFLIRLFYCRVFRILYIFWDTISLSDKWFSNIFSLLVACLYSLDSDFGRAKNFAFNKIQFLNYFFMDHDFDVVSKKSSPNSRSSRFTPMLSFRNFIILCFTKTYELIFWRV